MIDTNPKQRGSISLVLQRIGNQDLEITVSAQGCQRVLEHTLEGTEWNAAPLAKRLSRVRAVILGDAPIVADECGASIASIEDELRTFDIAFKVFDRYPRLP